MMVDTKLSIDLKLRSRFSSRLTIWPTCLIWLQKPSTRLGFLYQWSLDSGCWLRLLPTGLTTIAPMSGIIWIKSLEAISKRPRCNEDASKVKERFLDLNFSFPTNNLSSPVWPPSKVGSTFHRRLSGRNLRPSSSFLVCLFLRYRQINSMPPFNRLWPSGSLSYPLSAMMRTGFCRGRPPPFLGPAIFSIVASSSFISLAEAESRWAPIGTAWPSTTTIHPSRLCSWPLFLPKPNCHWPRFLPNLTGLVGPVRTGT